MQPKYDALIGGLRECESRLNYYAAHHIPKHLSHLLRSAASNIKAAIDELQLLNDLSATAGK